jgi:uncharacterized protein (TIGR04222 family)
MESRVDIPYTASAEQSDALNPASTNTRSMLEHAGWLQATGERALERGARDRRTATLLSVPAMAASAGLFVASDAVWDGTPELALLSNWLLVGSSMAVLLLACLWALYRRGRQRQETGRRLIDRARRQQQVAREAG